MKPEDARLLVDGVLIQAELPSLAWTMLRAKNLNGWCGTTYSLEEVDEMDPLVFIVLDALRQGIEPPRKGRS